jgi:saccharopepsin
MHGYARLSEDVLTLADGLQVPGQVFHEIKYYRSTQDPYLIELSDGVLGLAIEASQLPGRQTNILPSPFKSMIDSHLLDANMFSTVWPTDTREQGSLLFSGYDEDLLDGELVSHPLFPEDTTDWQIGVESV